MLRSCKNFEMNKISSPQNTFIIGGQDLDRSTAVLGGVPTNSDAAESKNAPVDDLFDEATL